MTDDVKKAAEKRAAAKPSDKPETNRKDEKTGQETRSSGHTADPVIAPPSKADEISENQKAVEDIAKKHDIDPADINYGDGAGHGHPTVDLGASSVRVADLEADLPEPDRWVVDNYRQLREERGISWADLAKDIESHDPRLAEYFKKHGADLDKRYGDKD